MSVRSQRMARGQCPLHGQPLEQTGITLSLEGAARPVFGCPEARCEFEAVPYPGSDLWRAIHGEDTVVAEVPFIPLEFEFDEPEGSGWDSGADDGVSRETDRP